MTVRTLPRKRLLSVCVSLACAACVAQAAAQNTVDTSITAQGGAVVGSNVVPAGGALDAAATAPPGTTVSASRFASPNPNGPPDSAWYSVNGDLAGNVLNRSSGGGTWASTGIFHQDVTVTNNLGTAASFFFTFGVQPGSLSVDVGSAAQTGEDGAASYALSILRGSSTLFESAGALTGSASGFGFAQTGFALGTYVTGAEYFGWNWHEITIDLGTLLPGESLELDYDLVTTSYGDFSSSTVNDPYCYGGVTSVATFFSSTATIGCSPRPNGSASARFGDPNSVTFDLPLGGITSRPVPTGVPEPGTLALLLAGAFAAMGWRRGRDIPVARS